MDPAAGGQDSGLPIRNKTKKMRAIFSEMIHGLIRENAHVFVHDVGL